jgi:hypothetical protein
VTISTDVRVGRRSPTADGIPQIRRANLHIPILGQLAATQLPLGDALEAGSLEVVRLNAALGGGPLGQEALEDATRDTDRAGVLPDLDPELHGLPLGIPAGVRGVHPFALSAPDEVPQGMQQTKRLGVVLD